MQYNVESLINEFSQIANSKSKLLAELPTNWSSELQRLNELHDSKVTELATGNIVLDTIDASITDTIHDVILCDDADPMPYGYIGTIIDSAYRSIYGWYRTIVHVKHGEVEFLLSVKTYTKYKLGRIFR